MLAQIAQILAPIAAITFIGYMMKRLGANVEARTISSLVVTVATPSLISSTLTGNQVTAETIETMATAALLCLAMAGGLGFFLLKVTGGSVRSFLPPLMLPNSGNMGLPLTVLAFGPDGIQLGVAFFTIVALVQSSVGLSIYAGSLRLGTLMRQPLIYAVVAVLSVTWFAIPVPSVVLNTTTLLGGMMMFGLFLSFVGTDPLGGVERFTLGMFDLKSGIPLLPMLIGLFALPEVASVVMRSERGRKLSALVGDRLTLAELRRCFRTICRSTTIGTAVGIVPGLGQIVAAVMGYSAAKNASKHPETFGEGEIEGVAAAEAANNAVNGPTMVPLLTLGILGDNVTAILLGAFVAQGLRPGPQLFEEQGAMVFAILTAMVIANFLFLIIGYLSVPFFSRLVSIRTSILIPLVIMFSFAGTYVYRSDPVDMLIPVAFGIFGIIAKAGRFDVMPLVMGFILGPTMEYAFGQTAAMANGNPLTFFVTERIGALAVLIATPVFGYLLWKRLYRKDPVTA